MTSDADDPDFDYWSTDIAAGSSASWHFDGAVGLERLSGPSEFTAPQPGSFRARLTRVQLDHVALEAFAATPHRSERTPERIDRFPTAMLTCLFLAEGRIQVEIDGTSFELAPGQFFVIDSRDPFSYTAVVESRLLLSSVGLEHVPAYLRERGMTIAGPQQATPLTDSFLAFASSILRSASSGRPATGAHLIKAVSDLQSTVLAEAQSLSGEQTGSAGMRYRMEEYIEAHLTDQALDPPSIADGLGISLRHAHNVFNDDQRTISRYIRDRRINAIALALRTRRGRVRLADLADQCGFTSAEAMARAFRERVGMSPSEYRASGHRTFEEAEATRLRHG